MLQDRPYLPRTINECLCHAPCKDFYCLGKHVRVWSRKAKGAFLPFRKGCLLYETEGGDEGCWWQSDEPPPEVDGRVQMLAQLRLSPTPEFGVPMPAFFGMTIISWSSVWGVEIYVAEAHPTFEDQLDCRNPGDWAMTVTANPGGRFPVSTLPGFCFWQWRARKDDWEPPV